MSNTVTYRDRVYTEKQATEISMCRAERWALLCEFNKLTHMEGDEPAKRKRQVWQRIQRLNAQLYKLTKNIIYLS